jgi:hypothetical protein
MLFWALLASGQINMRKIDGWQTLAIKPIDQQIDLLAVCFRLILGSSRSIASQIWS